MSTPARTSNKADILFIAHIVVLSVVIAYELVRRAALARQQRRVGRALAAVPAEMEGAPA